MRLEPDYYYENTDYIIEEMQDHAEKVFAEFKTFFNVPKYRELAVMMAKLAIDYGKLKDDRLTFTPCWPFGDVEAYAVLEMEDKWALLRNREDEF